MGVDGCRGGWCAVTLRIDDGPLRISPPFVNLSFRDILNADADFICIDIPIGLLEGHGRRSCDVEARNILGPRWPAVFDPPCRQALGQPTHQAASSINRAVTGRGLAIQAYCISNKIHEVDSLMTQELQTPVRELHPELCFYALKGEQPVTAQKRRVAGREERWCLLRRVLPLLPKEPPRRRELPGGCAPDDYIDALVAAWTALCLARHIARHIPEEPPIDAKGLRMEMWLPA